MADRIAQRLIAAGASPERAAAFSKQFAAARPGITPKKLEDAFDTELGAISQSIWPNTFRPQDLDDAQTVEYFIGVYGQPKYDQLIKTTAPTYSAALNSANQYIKDIASAAKQGISLDSVIASVRNDALTDESVFGGLKESDVITQVNKIYTDYTKTATAAKNFLAKDKYYKANLPDPKLKYGKQADLAAGVIDYKTHPSVEKYITEKPQEKLAISPGGAGISPIAARAARVPTGMAGVEAIQKPGKDYEDRLFDAFTKSGATPFFDEVKRRESVKGKTIK
jgi:hypothetical protein